MIQLCQYLCPQRHTILALAYESSQSPAAIEELLREQMARLAIHPWCGICGSTQLAFEHRSTRYQTMEEARPMLEREELKNRLAAAYYASQPKKN